MVVALLRLITKARAESMDLPISDAAYWAFGSQGVSVREEAHRSQSWEAALDDRDLVETAVQLSWRYKQCPVDDRCYRQTCKSKSVL